MGVKACRGGPHSQTHQPGTPKPPQFLTTAVFCLGGLNQIDTSGTQNVTGASASAIPTFQSVFVRQKSERCFIVVVFCYDGRALQENKPGFTG